MKMHSHGTIGNESKTKLLKNAPLAVHVGLGSMVNTIPSSQSAMSTMNMIQRNNQSDSHDWTWLWQSIFIRLSRIRFFLLLFAVISFIC